MSATPEQWPAPGVLEMARAAQRHTMPALAEIQRATTGTDEWGSPTTTWATLGWAPARIGNVGPGLERTLAERVVAQATAAITFPAGTDVTNHDRILLDGVFWEVLGTTAGSFETARQCAVSRSEANVS